MKKLGIILILIFLLLVVIHFVLSPKKNEFVISDLYDEIIARDKIKVGINIDSKPYGFIDKDGNYAGFNVDFARYIAQYLIHDRNKVEFISVTPSNRLLKASTGEVDVVISTVTITPQRKEIIDFSIPYDTAGQALLVKSNSKITSLKELAGQNVGVIFGTTAENSIRKLVPNANLLGYRSYKEAYIALKNDEINAITSDDTILNQFAIEDSSVKLLPKRYSQEPYGIAFRKGDSSLKLKENLDFAIKDLEQKKVLDRLKRKWNINF